MLSGLEKRAEAIGEVAAERAAETLAERTRAALPGVGVSVIAGGLLLAARGLTRRLTDDAQLRWIGSLWR